MEAFPKGKGPIFIYETLVRQWFLDPGKIDSDKEARILAILGGRGPWICWNDTPRAWIWWIDCLCEDDMYEDAEDFLRHHPVGPLHLQQTARMYKIVLTQKTTDFLCRLSKR